MHSVRQSDFKSSIRLLADSILQTEEMDPAMVRDFVSDIGSEAERLTRITEHLLALTRQILLQAVQQLPLDLVDLQDVDGPDHHPPVDDGHGGGGDEGPV